MVSEDSAKTGGGSKRPLAKPTPDLLVQFERLEKKAIEPLLEGYFDAVIDATRKLGESGEPEQQSEAMNAMRELSAKRRDLERNYLRNLEKPFKTLSRGGSAEKAKLSMDTLSLLDDQNLEETLAVNRIAEKVSSSFTEELDGVVEVLEKLYPKVSINENSNPVSPKNIVEALRHTFEDLEAPLAVRLALYRVFQNEVAAHLSKLYVELDHMLVSKNLVDKERSKKKISNPEVKSRESKKRDDDEEKEKSSGGGGGDGDGEKKGEGEGGGSGGGGGGGELVSTMQELVQAGVVGGPAHQGPVAPAPQVGTALNAFQSKALDIPAGTDPEAIGRKVKDQLSGAVQKLSGDPSLGVSQMDNAMIDVVSMIFDYILEDDNIPDSVKALLSRLQIPMLKVAIIDHSMFGNRDHPARRLLNTLAKAGVGIGEHETEKTNTTLHAISAIVHRVLQDFKDDVAIFEKLLNSFEKFLDARDRKEQAEEAKAVREARIREEIQLGKEEADQLIDDRLEDNPELPPLIRKLFDGPWRKAIVQAAATEGTQSDLWDERVKLVDDLIWSVTPMEKSEERKRLGQRIPDIVTVLRKGLEAVEVPQDKITGLLDALEPIHYENVSGKALKKSRGKSPQSEAPKSEEQSSDLLSDEEREFNELLAQTESTLSSLGDDDLEEEEAPPMDPEVLGDWALGDDILAEFNQEPSDPRLKKVDPATQPDDEFLELAQNLEVGQWFYLKDTDGEEVRAKLGWKSDYLQEYSFMNWKFKVVAEMSLYNLAAELRSGEARLIEKAPLMERALEAVTNLLKRKKEPEAEPDEA